MSLVEAVVLGDKEDRPVPEVLLLVVLGEPIFYGIPLADIDRRKSTVFGPADEYIYARPLKFGSAHDLFEVGAVEDDSHPRPVALLYEAESIGIAPWDENADGERALR